MQYKSSPKTEKRKRERIAPFGTRLHVHAKSHLTHENTAGILTYDRKNRTKNDFPFQENRTRQRDQIQ